MPRNRAADAIGSLLSAFGHKAEGPLLGTPERVAELWSSVLLKGEGQDLDEVLGAGTLSRAREPVCMQGIGVHLVCPHHLTVAFGHAAVAYVPGGRVVGFGRLSDLVAAATSRLVLQEEAGHDVVKALVNGLLAEAAVCLIEAVHPCHNLTRPRAHRAVALTLASAGKRGRVNELRSLLAMQRGAP